MEIQTDAESPFVAVYQAAFESGNKLKNFSSVGAENMKRRHVDARFRKNITRFDSECLSIAAKKKIHSSRLIFG